MLGREPLIRLGGRRRLPLIRQSTATECGLAAVAMVAGYFGASVDLVQLRRRFPVSAQGATLAGITNVCRALSLSTRGVRCGLSEISKLRTPCILHWRLDHFVVLKAARRDHLLVHDPSRGVVKVSFAMAADAFTGIALEVGRARGFRRARRPAKLKLASLMSCGAEEYRQFAAGLLLALVAETLLLVSPLYLQVTIDQVLVNGDRQLLNTLLAGFSLLLVFQVGAGTMRQLTFQYLSHVTVFDTSARVLHQLLQRSLNWFRSRDLGDVQHRILAMRHVQEFIVHAAPALVIDVLFITLITILMAVYDPLITCLVIAVTIAWCLWRAAILPVNLRLSQDIAAAEATVQTHFLETLRASQTVKMLAGEAVRESEWRGLFADATNARLRAGNLRILDSALRQLLFNGLRLAVIYWLARASLDGRMSIGMVSAFAAYLGMFVTRGGGIVDRIIEYRLLDVPLSRLEDIVFSGAPSERQRTRRSLPRERNMARDIALNNVAFRYSSEERIILRDCTCHIEHGSFVAIAGCSGSGKSTLLRLIAGIETPEAGELRIGGVRLPDMDVSIFRQQTGTVFEDDCLMKGSIAENIALFADDPDPEAIRRAAVAAGIAADIEAMPMNYLTRIGDLGSSLSKGQSQRVLLARALYRQPRLLLLDEATSGLDRDSERRVVDSLRRLKITRIAVTHSDQMLQAAHQVLWLNNGVLQNSRPELNV
jgi:ATP-binding cassette subfamily B protein RaxB